MSQFNVTTYDIERPTGQCAYTGRALEPGETYIATLVEVDPDPQNPKANPSGLKRLDVALKVWEAGQRPLRVFSFWKSVVPQPNQKKKVFVDDQVLMNLCKRLADAEQPQRLAFRFVLALILMRKKLLRYEGSRVEKIPASGDQPETRRELWKMVPKGEEEALEILNPQLDEAQIQQVTEQLGEILEGEL
jgi:hypothetical protein